MNFLPNEIVSEVLTYLTVVELSKFNRTSKKFNSLCKDILIFKEQKYTKLIDLIVEKTLHGNLSLKGKDRTFLVSYNPLPGFFTSEKLISDKDVSALSLFRKTIKHKYKKLNKFSKLLKFLLCNGYLYDEQDITSSDI